MQKEQRQFQGGVQIARIPPVSGLYAWYYRPLVVDTLVVSQTIASFLETPSEMLTEIEMRYGVHLVSKSTLKFVYGSQRQIASEVLDEVVACAENFLIDLFKSNALYFFTRPIYIGIAKNLYRRAYLQHYISLDEMWNDTSSISKHLNIFPNASVKSTMKQLNIPHSFPLEARVRRIAPRDLMVHIFPTNSLPAEIGEDNDDTEFDTTSRRALEKLLQLVSDPICGRR
ncbi:hypothetical protein WA1_24180 [Scytonema hofmannii PCC 7110]|uniref:Uncharacterized protein n=1 Tax=Scytonema hofmannii PCC 7110 TaxID=128403 RepID=A0A139X7T1_9CYAN|nr:hypothetical protein [Scytonema hofmannii]KYC40740.1 hypothetical protein WA1_24180 [Scytonema hofmannii PCC 7110]